MIYICMKRIIIYCFKLLSQTSKLWFKYVLRLCDTKRDTLCSSKDTHIEMNVECRMSFLLSLHCSQFSSRIFLHWQSYESKRSQSWQIVKKIVFLFSQHILMTQFLFYYCWQSFVYLLILLLWDDMDIGAENTQEVCTQKISSGIERCRSQMHWCVLVKNFLKGKWNCPL